MGFLPCHFGQYCCFIFKMIKFLFGLSIVGVVVSTPALKPEQSIKIVGGDDIDITEAPYQVSIMFRGRHSCGGTIVASDLIVTAAHCVGSNPNNYQIRAGSSYSNKEGQIYQVGDIKVNPDFNYVKMDSDIAVLWLTTPLEFNDKVKAIDMFEENEEIEDGAETIVTGWGHTAEGGGFPQTLQKVEVPKVSSEVCSVAYSPLYSITPRMLCAGAPIGGKDACQGDSGGPLVYNGKLAGVVSWGLGCARPKYPGVYAKVSALREWVDDSIAYLRMKHYLIARNPIFEMTNLEKLYTDFSWTNN